MLLQASVANPEEMISPELLRPIFTNQETLVAFRKLTYLKDETDIRRFLADHREGLNYCGIINKENQMNRNLL